MRTKYLKMQPVAALFLASLLLFRHGWTTEEAILIAPKSDLPAEAVAFPMKIEGDRSFVTARIGDESCACLVDTGAELTLVNKARVKLKDVRITGTQQLNGAFVGGISAQKAVVPSIRFGTSEHRDLAVGLIDHREGQKMAQFDMILGFDFLGRARFTLDYAHGRMILWPVQGDLPAPPKGIERIRLPLHRPMGELLPRVEGVVNGKARASFLIDTGAGGPYFVAFKKPADYDLELGAECGRMRFGGDKTREFSFYASTIKRFELGKLVLENQPVKVLDASAGVGASVAEEMRLSSNILGTPFLKQFSAVTFDLPNQCVYFDRAETESSTPPQEAPRKP